MIDKESLIKLLDKNNCQYKLYSHPPLVTVEDSVNMRGKINGGHTKNLFLKNKKNNFILITCLENTVVDLKLLQKNLNLGNLSFADEKYLKELLNVNPGAVTPFGLLNDVNHKIKFFFDINLNNFETFNFHPLVNTNTVSIKKEDFFNIFNINNICIYLLNLKTCEIKNGK
tara:strand:+ start:134 stop:646 length:513 start_codon:yes stop_codon:yes gene_type:complete